VPRVDLADGLPPWIALAYPLWRRPTTLNSQEPVGWCPRVAPYSSSCHLRAETGPKAWCKFLGRTVIG
jgi:hypothetical protein